jgi:6,7-dimethyl-8-ribityllumazine synthase
MRTNGPADHRPLPPINPSWRIGIVHSSYYPEEISALIASAKHALREAGIPETNSTLHPAPGSFEIPLIGAALAESRSVDALLGFGIIVEGETHHAELLARAVTRGIMDVQLRYTIPFAFEVLYVRSLPEARARGTRGREAVYAALHSLAEINRILHGRPSST